MLRLGIRVRIRVRVRVRVRVRARSAHEQSREHGNWRRGGMEVGGGVLG